MARNHLALEGSVTPPPFSEESESSSEWIADAPLIAQFSVGTDLLYGLTLSRTPGGARSAEVNRDDFERYFEENALQTDTAFTADKLNDKLIPFNRILEDLILSINFIMISYHEKDTGYWLAGFGQNNAL